eukprot:m.20080 g.20080  ORF g.20080 m.20080 type:complete len:180 (-) comp5527_c0_seq1:25-564(-)
MSARRSSAKMGKPAVHSGEENALFKKTVREVVIPPLEQGYSVSIGCFVGAILASVIAPVNGDALGILCGTCIAFLCITVLGAINTWWSPLVIGYPSAMALHYVVGVMMQYSQVAAVFGRFQYIDRVMYSTILGVAIGYSRDNTMNRSFAKLACGPEWDELDFTLNEPSDASGSQRGSTS